jgi:hypothetical protein
MIHTVRQGDKTSTIAARYGVTVDELLTANAHRPTVCLGSGQTVFAALGAGEELVVPSTLGILYPDGRSDNCGDHGVPDAGGGWFDDFGTCLKKVNGEPICGNDIAFWGSTCPSSEWVRTDGGETRWDDNGLVDILLRGVKDPQQRQFSCCRPVSGSPPPFNAPPQQPSGSKPTTGGGAKAPPAPPAPAPPATAPPAASPVLTYALIGVGVVAAAGAAWWGIRAAKAS